MEAIQIAIGGVPNGNKTYGDSKAIGYVEQLYNREVGNSPYKYYFKIEVREEEGKECFYYSYIVPQITDQSGRSGGYFAIVLRSCNHYCEDLSRLYQLLKQTYDKKVEGVLLGKDKKFIVSNFDKANSESIIQFLRRNIDNCFSQSFTLLDRKLNKNGKCVKRHISEQGCDLFLNTLFECGEAILAPEIHRSENKLQPLEAKIKKLNDIIMAKNKSIQDLENKKGELEEQNAELKSENDKLQREVEKSRNADDALRQIREILDNTLGARSNAYVAKSRDYNKERENPVDASLRKNKKKILIWSIVILAFFLLGFGIGIVSTHKKTDEQTEQSKEQTEQSKEQTTQAIRSIRLDRDILEKEHTRKIHSGDTILFVADATSVMDWGVDGFEEISSCYVVTKSDIDTATISFTDYLGEKSKHRFPVK